VAQLLLSCGAQLDAGDCRNAYCLLAAFVTGQTHVVQWIIKTLKYLPSDSDLSMQAAKVKEHGFEIDVQNLIGLVQPERNRREEEANKNAAILLQEGQQKKRNRRSVSQKMKTQKQSSNWKPNQLGIL